MPHKKTRNTYLVLAVIYISYFAFAMDTGAYSVAWPSMMDDLNLPLGRAGITFIVQSLTYTITSMFLGAYTRLAKLETINMVGCILMALGFLGFPFVPDFTSFLLMLVPIGIGMGLVDSSLNAYMAESFTSRELNWMNCFFGLGAAISPIIMTQMVLRSGWRLGYLVIAILQVLVALMVVVSRFKGIWKKEEGQVLESSEEASSKNPILYLKRKRHQAAEIAIFFLYGGVEYSAGFWITVVLTESRGVGIELAGWFPAVYYGATMVGRIVFGYLSNRLKDINMIRMGFAMAFVGVIFLFATGNLGSMALVGFGMAPIFPCLMHDTGNRFSPKILTRLVGFEMAAFGAGIAILSSLMGQVMSYVNLEAFFPMLIVLMVIVFFMNEGLEQIAKRKAV